MKFCLTAPERNVPLEFAPMYDRMASQRTGTAAGVLSKRSVTCPDSVYQNCSVVYDSCCLQWTKKTYPDASENALWLYTPPLRLGRSQKLACRWITCIWTQLLTVESIQVWGSNHNTPEICNTESGASATAKHFNFSILQEQAEDERRGRRKRKEEENKK